MNHDYDKVFYTNSAYWQKVLDIYKNNEHYEKCQIKGRHLHHKFPKSFSKILGEPVDNDKDNLVSLSWSDHFKVHYYYSLLAKGYEFLRAAQWSYKAIGAFVLNYITPEVAEHIAANYHESNDHKCIRGSIRRAKNIPSELKELPVEISNSSPTNDIIIFE